MVYYKIPLSGGLDYPAGCILLCAYTYEGYEYCKFERVTEVGSSWVAITEAEFNVRCPEFPTPKHSGWMEDEGNPGCYYRIVDGEFEWLNPPMLAGAEYRTAERFDELPVYVQLLHFDELAAAGSYAFAEFAEKTAKIHSISGTIRNPNPIPCETRPLPYIADDGTVKAVAYAMKSIDYQETVGVRIQCISNLQTHTADVIVKYTKP